MKKGASLLLPVLLIVFLGLSGCVSVKPVELKGVNSFKVGESASSNGMVITTNLSLYNPNGFEFVINNADIDVYVENVNLGKLKLPERVQIPSKSEFTGDFYIEISFSKLLLSGQNILSKIKTGKVQIQLKGTIDTDFLWISKVFEVDYDENIEL